MRGRARDLERAGLIRVERRSNKTPVVMCSCSDCRRTKTVQCRRTKTVVSPERPPGPCLLFSLLFLRLRINDAPASVSLTSRAARREPLPPCNGQRHYRAKLAEGRRDGRQSARLRTSGHPPVRLSGPRDSKHFRPGPRTWPGKLRLGRRLQRADQELRRSKIHLQIGGGPYNLQT